MNFTKQMTVTEAPNASWFLWIRKISAEVIKKTPNQEVNIHLVAEISYL